MIDYKSMFIEHLRERTIAHVINILPARTFMLWAKTLEASHKLGSLPIKVIEAINQRL